MIEVLGAHYGAEALGNLIILSLEDGKVVDPPDDGLLGQPRPKPRGEESEHGGRGHGDPGRGGGEGAGLRGRQLSSRRRKGPGKWRSLGLTKHTEERKKEATEKEAPLDKKGRAWGRL